MGASKTGQMKLRHAAALALAGWYLMLPPAKNGQIRDAPIELWAHIDSFDTADQCRDAAQEIMKRADSKGDQTRIAAAYAYECIASDDPRLKPK